ncbi:hypothetical protein [Actinomadura sp. 3N407]
MNPENRLAPVLEAAAATAIRTRHTDHRHTTETAAQHFPCA